LGYDITDKQVSSLNFRSEVLRQICQVFSKKQEESVVIEENVGRGERRGEEGVFVLLKPGSSKWSKTVCVL
jgi:hypothetical protein